MRRHVETSQRVETGLFTALLACSHRFCCNRSFIGGRIAGMDDPREALGSAAAFDLIIQGDSKIAKIHNILLHGEIAICAYSPDQILLNYAWRLLNHPVCTLNCMQLEK